MMPSSSTAAAPAAPSPSSSNTPFLRLKPICVQLLGLTSTTAFSKQQAKTLTFALQRLKHLLADLASQRNADDDVPLLTPALIHYVFFPIAQLLRSSRDGAADLPDQARQLVFECLSLLVSHWWRAWAQGATSASAKPPAQPQWAVWQQLVILASVAIGGSPSVHTPAASSSAPSPPPPSSSFSDEARCAALEFLLQLLQPRFESPRAATQLPKGKQRRQQQKDWEWDGVSDLPALDELEREEADEEAGAAAAAPTAADQGKAYNNASSVRQQIYPSTAHLDFFLSNTTARGALGHALASCLELSCQSDRMVELRVASLRAAHVILTTWFATATDVSKPTCGPTDGGDDNAVFQLPALAFVRVGSDSASAPLSDETRSGLAERAATRVRPLLPGITSSLTRLISSRLKKHPSSAAQRETPALLSSIALSMLRDLILLSLGDVTTRAFREKSDSTEVKARLAEEDRERMLGDITPSIRTLDDFAAAAQQMTGDDPAAAQGPVEAQSDQSQATDDDAEVTSELPPTEGGADEADTAPKYLLSTLARIQIALRSFAPLAAPFSTRSVSSPPTHTATRRALVALAASLFVHMGGTLAWFDARLRHEAAVLSAVSRESALEMLFSWLVDSSGDNDIETVARDARGALEVIFAATSGDDDDDGDDTEPTSPRARTLAALSAMTARALAELPKAVRAQDDGKVERLANRLKTAASLASGTLKTETGCIQSPEAVAALAQLLGPAGGVEQWGTGLADALRINASHVTASQDLGTAWPPRPALQGLETASSRSIMDMLRTFGRAAACVAAEQLRQQTSSSSPPTFGIGKAKTDLATFHLVLFFIRQGRRYRTCCVSASDGGGNGDLEAQRTRSLTALMIASELVRGVAEELDDAKLATLGRDVGKRLRRTAHKLGKQVFELVMEMWEGDWEEVIDSDLTFRPSTEHQLDGGGDSRGGRGGDARDVIGLAHDGDDGGQLVERVKGLSLSPTSVQRPERFGPALDLAFVGPATINSSALSTANRSSSGPATLASRLTRATSSLLISNSYLLSLLSSSSLLLGTSFRPLLLQGMYPLTAGLASSDQLVRTSADLAFRDVAHASNYASVESCVLDHADYLLGAACQRLVSGLDEELRATCLSPSHPSEDGNTTVMPFLSAQRAPFVLVEMIRMLGSEVVPLVEDAVDEILDALDRFHAYRDVCTGLLGVLEGTLEVLASEEKQIRLDRSPIATHRSGDTIDEFEKWYRRTVEPCSSDDQDETTPQTTDDPPVSSTTAADEEATQTQKVVETIMSKSVPFLSHASSHFRLSVLQLLQHGVCILGSQKRQGQLLPIINAFWPFLMARLGRSTTSSSGGVRKEAGILTSCDTTTRETRGMVEGKGSTETEPFVWIEAVRLVETCVEHVGEFVSRKVEREAWPRLQHLLHLHSTRYAPRSTNHLLPVSTSLTTTKTHHATTPFILPSSSSLQTDLTISILSVLSTVTTHLGVRMSEKVAWSIATDPNILATLDSRQPSKVTRQAQRLYRSLASRNWDATWLVLSSAFPSQSSKTPEEGGMGLLWLRQDAVQVEKNLVDRLLVL